MPDKKHSTWQILRGKFPEAEYVLIAEVSDASGFSRRRSLDYMVINLWESRGLSISGIEKKSNRSDWLKELKQPAKQENHFKYCDYFYLLTDKENVAKLEEIPTTWGWYHITQKGFLKTMKAAPQLPSVPVDRSLLCAMLRRAADKRKYVHVDNLESEIQTRAEQLHNIRNAEAARVLSDYEGLTKRVEAFQKATGINIRYTYPDDIPMLGKAIRTIADGGIKEYEQSLERLGAQVMMIHKHISTELKDLKEIKSVQHKISEILNIPLMARYRKKPLEIEAHQWFKNGDHPLDNSNNGEKEGDLVRYFRHPEKPGTDKCQHCGKIMHVHGWIDTKEGGHIVCPGDFVITGVKGEHYPCKPDIFEMTYDKVEEQYDGPKMNANDLNDEPRQWKS